MDETKDQARIGNKWMLCLEESYTREMTEYGAMRVTLAAAVAAMEKDSHRLGLSPQRPCYRGGFSPLRILTAAGSSVELPSIRATRRSLPDANTDNGPDATLNPLTPGIPGSLRLWYAPGAICRQSGK
ncbi:hypothetical protein VE02_06473 [Pseudogymnoascus sp. 03VT05]|nr:hypothetical protein VE02_06473 [Pseudogymnoascus sp. 03VT05]